MQIFKNDTEKRRADSIVFGMRSDRLEKEALDKLAKDARELDEQIRTGKLCKDIVSAPSIYDHVMRFNSLSRKADSAMDKHIKDVKATADKLQAYAESGLKTGRTITSIPSDVIQEYADKFRDHADKSLSIMKDHTKAVRSEADDLANTMQGSEVLYANDRGTPDPGQQEGTSKRRHNLPQTRYSSKSMSSRTTQSRAIALVKKLPEPLKKQFQYEYNACSYGEEDALIEWYESEYLP